jgi:transposase
MAKREELTDEQWSLIESFFDKAESVQTRGRPRCENREVMNGVLWILRSGARWCDLPGRFPPCQTCHRRFQEWVKDGTLRRVLETLAADLHSRGGLDLSECFIDGTFIVAKKGASEWEKPSGERYETHGSGRWLWSSSRRLPGKCFSA